MIDSSSALRIAARALLCLLATSHAAVRAEDCPDSSTEQIASLFERWNSALQGGDAQRIVELYAPGSVLLPTVSNLPRISEREKLEYFEHFMAGRPRGKVESRWIDIVCATAVDAGTYTFTFADGRVVHARYTFTYRNIGGRWLITSHHSSRMPETLAR